MLLAIRHTTRYRYPSPVVESHNEVRMKPMADSGQTCLEFDIAVRPSAVVSSHETPWGTIHQFDFREPHEEMEIRTASRVETRGGNPFEGLNLEVNDWDFIAAPSTRLDYAEYLAATRLAPLEPAAARIAALARERGSTSVASFVISLTRLLNRILTYDPGATSVQTTLGDFLQDRRGVCQDFAHLMLAVCRTEGIPARYVSGYHLLTGAAAEARHDARHPAMHAWVECLMPDHAWRGFDPTNSLLADDTYVKVHVGRDYHDVSPTRGVYRGPAESRLDVEVDVRRVD